MTLSSNNNSNSIQPPPKSIDLYYIFYAYSLYSFLAMINIILKSVSLFYSGWKKSSQTYAIFYRSTQHHFIVNIVFARKIQTMFFFQSFVTFLFRISSITLQYSLNIMRMQCLFGCCSIIIKISWKYMTERTIFA